MNKKIAVAGTGYVGLSLAVLLAQHNQVTAVDIVSEKVELINKRVCEMFGGRKEDIKVIGIRHGEKMYETLLTNEECAKAIDLGGFYRVPADNRGLNYDKYFKEGDAERNTLTEFNSNNTQLLTKEEIKAKMMELTYIQERLAEE